MTVSPGLRILAKWVVIQYKNVVLYAEFSKIYALKIATGDILETSYPRTWGKNSYNKFDQKKTLNNIFNIVFCR